MSPLQDLAAFVAAVAAAYAKSFGDVDGDLIAVEDLERLLDDFGVPDMGLALVITDAVRRVASLKAASPPGDGPWWYRPGPSYVGR